MVATEDQTEMFITQYLETLDLYRNEFGMEPPENIWGTPKFNKERINSAIKKSKKKNYDGGVGGDFSSDGPLHSNYDEGSLDSEFSGFDGGDFGGGGAGGDFGDGDGGAMVEVGLQRRRRLK